MIDKTIIFAEVKRLRGGRAFTQAEVSSLDQAIDRALGMGPPPVILTRRAALEIICHEAIVQEAYKDSKGIWTWSVGLTNAAGINVLAYKDNPQSLEVCLAAYINRLKTAYLPAVLEAFHDYPLQEHELTAALSFHYNTGAIKSASWVQSVRHGHIEQAKVEMMNWRKPASIIERREKERDLFFDGHWCNDGLSLVYPVRKPSYTPDWGRAKKVDVRPIIEQLIL